jgi:anti-anti-sigma regulatory factor
MLRIEKRSDGQATVLRISGRIEAERLSELQVQLGNCAENTIIDLEEVKLVDRAVVRFLGLCESNGIELLNCAFYIREWIFRENGRNVG